MKRNAVIYAQSDDGRRCVALDAEHASELLAYVRQDERHAKKFNYIVSLLLRGLHAPDLYDKEAINERCRDVTAMKLFKGQENDRIYCKELTDKSKRVFVVVAARLHERKKSQKNKQAEISLIETVATYSYEYTDFIASS